MTDAQLNKLKSAGFRRDEISHFKAGRYNKIAKNKLRRMKAIIKQKKKRELKPFVITNDGVTLKKSKYIIIL